VYDALSSRRVYKESLPHEQCLEYIRSAAGGHFDPDLVAIWLTVESQFAQVARQFGCVPQNNQGPGHAPGRFVISRPSEAYSLFQEGSPPDLAGDAAPSDVDLAGVPDHGATRHA
jgi:hypothetical protein